MEPFGGVTIRTIVLLLLVSGAIMIVLGLLRFPFAVRFWRRVHWLSWVWVAVLIFAALRLWFFG